MSGVSTVNLLEFHRNITDHKNKKIKQASNLAPAILQRGLG
jgi:hypothetical protein